MLRWFGVNVEAHRLENNGIQVNACAIAGPANFAGRDVGIPGDFSSAAFLLAAAALLPGSELEIEGVGLNPTRTQLLDVLRAVGAKIETAEAREICNELQGTLRIRGMESGAELPVRTPGATNTGGTPVPHFPMTIEGRLSAALDR